jgi:leucyl-tRNA synthetase
MMHALSSNPGSRVRPYFYVALLAASLVLAGCGFHLRGKIVVPAKANKLAIEKAAREAPEVARHGAGTPVKKVIVVPGRLVNVVV